MQSNSINSLLNIGMISTYAVKCGIATYTKYLCDALYNQEVYLEILGEKPYPQTSFCRDFTTSIPFRFNWIRGKPLTNIINSSDNFNILHIQHEFSLFPDHQVIRQLMDETKKPVVLTLHNIIPRNPQLFTYFKTLLEADRLIVHTKTCFNLLSYYLTDISKISLIPHGTPQMDLLNKAGCRKALGLPDEVEIILSWGFINENKGLLELVQAFSQIIKGHPKAILVHVGGIHPVMANPAHLMKILQTARNYGIQPNQFQITDWVSDSEVLNWFAASDIIILNYARNHACASGSAHVALAAHRPIVKTDDPSLEDIPGYEVPRSSPANLRDAILRVLDDQSLQKKLVTAADKAAKATSWEVVARQHKQLYHDLL